MFKALATSLGWGDEASTTPVPVPSAVLRRLKALRRTLSDEAKLSALIECTRHPDGRPRYSFTHDQVRQLRRRFGLQYVRSTRSYCGRSMITPRT